MLCPGRPLLSAVGRLRCYSTNAIVLRPYQEACLDACLEALNRGLTRIGVSLPTGAGKTTVFISLLSRLSSPPNAPEASRALVIVNSVELAQQTANHARRQFPDWSVEIEQGKSQASGTADLTVATFQTLSRLQRLQKFRAQYLKALIVDEAHHAAASSYRRILSHFDSNVKSPDENFEPPSLTHRIPILGFSATFSRHDGLALGSVFEEVVYHRDFLDMVKEQWLCQVRFTTVEANINLSDVTVNSRTGDFNPTSLADVINTEAVNELVVRAWLDKASDRKSTLIFCVNLSHVHSLTAAFRAAGIDARYVHARTPAAERKALIGGFKEGEYPVLLNCAVLTEGADIPNIDCVMVARPTKSRNLFAQMIGRGMRLSPSTGKDDCRIIDFVDSQARVAGVLSMPTLLGLNPSELNEEEDLDSILERRKSKLESDVEPSRPSITGQIPAPKSVTYVDHDDPFVLADQASGDPNLRTLSRNAWVSCGDENYVLECMGKGFVRISPLSEPTEEEKFIAYYTSRTMPQRTAFVLKISPFRQSKKVLTAATLAAAIRGCDTYVRKEVVPGALSQGLLRTARWRWEPATASQKTMIMKRWKGRKVVGAADGRRRAVLATEEGLKSMTKGEAANIITRLKYGAQTRYEKKRKAMAKAVLAEQKESRRRAREHVQVGPLPRVL